MDQTPNAGQAVEQPAAQVRRYERAVFKWGGGDPAVDAPRGQALVSLQRLESGVWTNGRHRRLRAGHHGAGRRRQLDRDLAVRPLRPARHLPLPRHGRGGHGGRARARTRWRRAPFQLLPTAPLTAAAPVVANGEASVTATYPDPGDGALLALPRRVRSGSATLLVDGQPEDGADRPGAPALHGQGGRTGPRSACRACSTTVATVVRRALAPRGARAAWRACERRSRRLPVHAPAERRAQRPDRKARVDVRGHARGEQPAREPDGLRAHGRAGRAPRGRGERGHGLEDDHRAARTWRSRCSTPGSSGTTPARWSTCATRRA